MGEGNILRKYADAELASLAEKAERLSFVGYGVNPVARPSQNNNNNNP